VVNLTRVIIPTTMQEMKPIEGFPNYSITRDGKLWNHKLNRFMKRSNRGTCFVLSRKNKRKSVLASTLVADAFPDTLPNLPEMKPIPTLSGYSITRDGKLYSCKRSKVGRFLTTHVNIKGYKTADVVFDDGKKIAYPIHRLVALAYLPNPENKLCVDHINRHRFDNRVENLRWATCKENSDNMVVGRGYMYFCKLKKNEKNPWRVHWCVGGKDFSKYLATKQEADAYLLIVYQLRCAIRRMRGLNY